MNKLLNSLFISLALCWQRFICIALILFLSLAPNLAAKPLLIRLFSAFKIKTININSAQGKPFSAGGKELGKNLTISAQGKNLKIKLEDRSFSAPSFSINAEGKGAYLSAPSAPRRLYRGPIKFSVDTKGYLKIINTVSTEEYLPSVLTGEIGKLKHIEAYKAQAIAARTYTLTLKNNHIKDGYNLCDCQHCQVYLGLEGIKPKAAEAIHLTKGQILNYKGKPAATFYHSACGGYTEDITKVWSSNQAKPYLIPVKDGENIHKPYCSIAPKLHWKTKLYFTGLTRIGKQNGWLKAEEEAVGLRISESSQISGRVHELEIYTRERRIKISATDFYNGFGRKATWQAVKSTNFKLIQGRDYVILDGKGSGHGVGLCQWGAEGMAKQGFNYKQILYHYYPGTVLSYD